jgi:hypothetical protein
MNFSGFLCDPCECSHFLSQPLVRETRRHSKDRGVKVAALGISINLDEFGAVEITDAELDYVSYVNACDERGENVIDFNEWSEQHHPLKPDETAVREFVSIIVTQFERSISTAQKRLVEISEAEGRNVDAAEHNAGSMQTCYIDPDKGGPQSRRFPSYDVDAIVKSVMLSNGGGFAAYIESRTINEIGLKSGQRGKGKATQWVSAIVMDIDADKGDRIGDGVTLEPSLIVQTSEDGNEQLWYFLDSAVKHDAIDDLRKRMKAIVGGDAGASGRDGLYRVAGTVNYPNEKKKTRGRGKRMVKIIEYSRKVYSLEELYDAFPQCVEPPKATLTHGGKREGSGRKPKASWSKSRPGDASSLPDAVRDKIVNGINDPNADRSQEVYHLVRALASNGWSAEQIVAAFLEHPNGIGARYNRNDKRAEDDVRRCYDKWAKWQEELNRKVTIQIFSGNEQEIMEKTENALIDQKTPIFKRGGKIFLIVHEDMDDGFGHIEKHAQFKALDPRGLSIEMMKVARYESPVFKEGALVDFKSENTPLYIADAILHNYRDWKFPAARGIITCPTFRPNGTLLQGTEPFYDRDTGLYFSSSVTVPPVSDHPSDGEWDEALKLLEDLNAQFPFDDEVSRAVGLSGLMTPVYSGICPAVPIHHTNAIYAGSGKTEHARTGMTIGYGHSVQPLPLTMSDEELEKQLLSLILAGDQGILLDNAKRDIPDLSTVCAIVTGSGIVIRPFGKLDDNRKADCRVAIFTNGNGVYLCGDLAERRALVAKMAGQARPSRNDRGTPPSEIVKANRGKYVWAVLTITKRYLADGEPEVDASYVASFDLWRRFVQRPLVYAGIGDPVQSMDVAAEFNPEYQQTLRLLTLAYDLKLTNPGTKYSITDIIARAYAENVDPVAAKELQALMHEVSAGPVPGKHGAESVSRERLAHWLKPLNEKRVKGMRLVIRPTSRGHRYSFVIDKGCEPKPDA